MNTHRRVFRGRAGPTDGRLPKHNARRRIVQTQTTKGSDKYGDAPLPTTTRSSSEHTNNKEEEDEGMEDSVSQQVPPPLPEQAPPIEPWRTEVRHLTRRIKNVQESIQLGTEGIANPTTYQQNVLHAVENCINEWRAIVNHYHYKTVTATPTTTTIEDAGMDPETLKETGLAVYMLLQLSVQCGPLAGGKPGYFKRCGGHVARLVVEYLHTNVPDDDACAKLQFSPKQTQAIAAWRINAGKAALEDKPPSKSALKAQQGISKKKKKNKK